MNPNLKPTLMNVLEKELEDMIWQGINVNRALLRKKGLWVWDNASYHRQVDFGSYGVCDILGLYVQPKQNGHRYVGAQIIELKKDEINTETFYQALRYAKAVTRIVEERLTNTSCACNIVLIGKSIDCIGEFVYLPDVFSNITLLTYKLDFQYGVVFSNENGYCIGSEKFSNTDVLKASVVKMIREQIKGPELPF